MSDDGRYVGFHGVHHLAPCGTNIHGTGFSSFYVRDRVAGTTVRVSTFADGLAAPTGDSIPLPRMDLSADGHVAAYVSDVPLAPDDVDETANVYVHDVFAPVGAPDAAIARGSGPVAGANFCNSTPVFQTRIATLSPGESVSFTVTFGNLSDHPDALLLHGGGGKPGFNVKYFRGKRDVTTGVLAGTRRTRPLEREERVTYRLRVRVRLDADAGDVLAILIRSSSTAQPAVTDVVRARVTVS
jgi:hypothetical protein